MTRTRRGCRRRSGRDKHRLGHLIDLISECNTDKISRKDNRTKHNHNIHDLILLRKFHLATYNNRKIYSAALLQKSV
ncbi:hypothetical protein NSPZN2_20050 [Nitrospira defluvii]|uniref:Transposase n=1 Tax=Nitrospira defluvii TaxID=330214 RepID=A0ABN7LKS8_9BACT|nr:hypothetical protein NSPZN2_20050 [Nitrospira defluvii]